MIDDGSRASVTSGTVREVLRARIDGGQHETWPASSFGRLPAFVTNKVRAMMSLLNEEGDPGEHAVDLGVDGSSHLSQGQHDEYPNVDTVPLEEAFRILSHVLSEGSRPPDTSRMADR